MEQVLSQQEWSKPVMVVPLVQAFPEFNDVKTFRSKKCIFAHDRSKLFNVVSSKYEVVDHDSAIKSARGAIEMAFGEVIEPQVTVIAGGARMCASFMLPFARPIEVAKGDIVRVGVQMLNSHDGMWKFGFSLMAYRLVCKNGATVGEKFGSFSVKHFAALAKPDLLAERIKVLVARSAHLQELWQEWSAEKVSFEQAEALIGKGVFPEKYVRPLLEPGRYPRTKWNLYNDLTAFATHNTKTVNRRVEFDSVISGLFYKNTPIPAGLEMAPAEEPVEA